MRRQLHKLIPLALSLLLILTLSGCTLIELFTLPDLSGNKRPRKSPRPTFWWEGAYEGDDGEEIRIIDEDLPEQVRYVRSLQAQNADCIGYLHIPDTQIDAPVVHSQADNNLYLFLNLEKKFSIEGSIFLDGHCDTSPRSTNWLLHGHNMLSGSMFAGLLKYKKEEYFKEHPLIYLATADAVETYEIFACYPTHVLKSKDEGFRYYDFLEPANEKEFDAGIAEMKKSALYDTGIAPVYGDKLLTLSTCEYTSFNGRMVVVARLVAEKDAETPDT